MIRKNAARRPRKAGTTKTPGRAAPPQRRPSPSSSPSKPRPATKPQPAESRQPLPAPVLSPKQRRELRARAHALEPVVQVGHGGISPAVVRAVSRALLDHELIKVRLHEPDDKRAMSEQLAGSTRAALCGLIGHTVILYRPKPKPKRTSGVARSAIKRNQTKRGRQL